MILVDTGFFLALAQPRDALHLRALAWAREIRDQLLVTDYVLWETVNALSEPRDRPKAHHLLDQIGASANFLIVPATTEFTAAAVKLHAARMDKGWSLSDCASFVVMAERGVREALAHDHNFEQAGFTALLRSDPP